MKVELKYCLNVNDVCTFPFTTAPVIIYDTTGTCLSWNIVCNQGGNSLFHLYKTLFAVHWHDLTAFLCFLMHYSWLLFCMSEYCYLIFDICLCWKSKMFPISSNLLSLLCQNATIAAVTILDLNIIIIICCEYLCNANNFPSWGKELLVCTAELVLKHVIFEYDEFQGCGAVSDHIEISNLPVCTLSPETSNSHLF